MENIEDCLTAAHVAQFIRDEIDRDAPMLREEWGSELAFIKTKQETISHYAHTAENYEPDLRLNIMQALLILMTETT